jgi:hypothetical protein
MAKPFDKQTIYDARYSFLVFGLLFNISWFVFRSAITHSWGALIGSWPCCSTRPSSTWQTPPPSQNIFFINFFFSILATLGLSDSGLAHVQGNLSTVLRGWYHICCCQWFVGLVVSEINKNIYLCTNSQFYKWIEDCTICRYVPFFCIEISSTYFWTIISLMIKSWQIQVAQFLTWLPLDW